MQYRYSSSYALVDALLLLLFAYVLKFSDILVDIDLVLLTWVFLAIYTILTVRLNVLIHVGIIHSILLVGYAIPYFINKDSQLDLEYGRNLASSFILASLFLGFVKNELRDSKGLHKRIVNSEALVFILYIPVAVWIAFIFYQSEISGVNVVQDYGGANYLTPSDLLAMATLLTLSVVRIPRQGKILITIFTASALVLLGSRASMAIFIFSYVITLQSMKITRKIAMLAFLAIVLWAFYFIVSERTVDLLFRFNTISDLTYDSSRIVRQQLLMDYYYVLMESPQCWFIACPPSPGDYVHNIISIQQYFGIVGTVTVVLIMILFAINTLKNRSIPLIPLGAYVVIQTLLFRSWQSLTFPIFIGILSYYPLIKKNA